MIGSALELVTFLDSLPGLYRLGRHSKKDRSLFARLQVDIDPINLV